MLKRKKQLKTNCKIDSSIIEVKKKKSAKF